MDKSNITVSFRIDSESFELFKRRYPRVFSAFLRKCVAKAINDKSFFDNIYFGDCSFLLSDNDNDNCID